MPTTMNGVYYVPSAEELKCDRNIARWKRDLHLVKKAQALFKRMLTGTGYHNDAEYQEANKLAESKWRLERSIKDEQGRKRKWAALNRKNAAR